MGAIDDKLYRVQPFKKLAIIFNDDEMVIDNFFVDHAHGDEDLKCLYHNLFRERTESFLKGDEYTSHSFDIYVFLMFDVSM